MEGKGAGIRGYRLTPAPVGAGMGVILVGNGAGMGKKIVRVMGSRAGSGKGRKRVGTGMGDPISTTAPPHCHP